MAVAIAADAASMTRARVDGTRTRVGDADMRDDAHAMSLRFAHVTASLNVTHALAGRCGGGVGARSLALACDGGGDRPADGAPMARARVDNACARIGDAHVREDARAMSLRIARVTVSLNNTHGRASGGSGGGVGSRSLALVCDGGGDRGR